MTVYAIRHRRTGLFWWGHALLGDVWGGASMARRFDFMTAALAVGLYTCQESPEDWDIALLPEAA